MTSQHNDPQQELVSGAAFGAIAQMTAALDRGAQLDTPIPLVEQGPTALPFAGHHALSAAVFYGKPQIVAWLLARGARVAAPFGLCGRGPFPLLDGSFAAAPAGPGSLMHTAARCMLTDGGSQSEVSRVTLEIMQLLGAAGVGASLRDLDGATPLHLAAAEGKRAAVATFLLDAGCPLDVVDRAGWTALDRAVEESFVDVLLTRGANPDGKAPACGPHERFASRASLAHHDHWPQLTSIIYRRAHGIARARLRHGAHATPHALYFAARHAQFELVEALLRAGADPNDQSPNAVDGSALAAAVRTGEVRCVEALLGAQALVDEFTFQPSDAEVGGQAVFALLAPRVDRATRSRILVRLASSAGAGQLAALLDCGADLDTWHERPSRKGAAQYTALHAAAEAGQEHNVACLLKYGAHDCPGPGGASARELAQRCTEPGARACVALLTAGATPAALSAAPAAPVLQVGGRVLHAKFGSGRVAHLESGNADGRKVKIHFEDGVVRTLLARFVQPA